MTTSILFLTIVGLVEAVHCRPWLTTMGTMNRRPSLAWLEPTIDRRMTSVFLVSRNLTGCEADPKQTQPFQRLLMLCLASN